jgi:hypothetical protein
VVPDLVQLTYHYDRDTRFWAQISLVRLTGENFGRDVAAWRQWWEKQGGKPSIAKETVAWATSPEKLSWADPKGMELSDSQLFGMAHRLSTADGRTGQQLPTQPPSIIQSETNVIQPDGTIRFTVREGVRNHSTQDMKTYQFMTSDFCKVEKIACKRERDGTERPSHFTTEHIDDTLHYNVSLDEPVPAGQTLVLEYEGTITTLIKPTGQPGVFKYHMIHSPNAPLAVWRIEVHRLPPGAELLERSPKDMTETRKDNRIELRVERVIPTGGTIEVSYHYRMSGTNQR